MMDLHHQEIWRYYRHHRHQITLQPSYQGASTMGWLEKCTKWELRENKKGLQSTAEEVANLLSAGQIPY